MILILIPRSVSRVLLLTFVALVTTFSPARSAVVTTGCASVVSCTLEELTTGGTITVNGLRFSDFVITTASRNPGFPPQESLITVEGLDDGGSNPGPGLRYNFDDELTLASGGLQDMTFQFNFLVEDTLGLATIIGHTLDMVDFINAGNPGQVDGQLNVRDRVETLAAVVLDTALVDSVKNDAAMVDVLNNPDTISFAPQDAVRVFTIVNGMTRHQLALETLDQRFSVVIPEPGTAGMLFFGAAALLLGAGWRRRA